MSANYNPSPHFPRTWNAHKACVSLWFWSIMRQRCHLLNVYIDLEDAPGIVRVVRVLWNSSFNFLGGGRRNCHPSSTTENCFHPCEKEGRKIEERTDVIKRTSPYAKRKTLLISDLRDIISQKGSLIPRLHGRSLHGEEPGYTRVALWHYPLLYLDLDCNFWQGTKQQPDKCSVAKALLR